VKRIAIIYESFSGNTETTKDLIEEELGAQGIECDVFKPRNLDPVRIHEYDGIIFGTLSWGDGALPRTFSKLVPEMDRLEGKVVGVFGTGDDTYSHFCGGVDVIVNILKEKNTVMGRLKILLKPKNEKERDRCRAFAARFAKVIKAEGN
jgi:flavodoxin I